MRLWSIHPRYLDAKGLVALWREALLAKHVLEGRTKGYTRHPQLVRFKQAKDPLAAINAYLAAVHAESVARGYRFDAGRIDPGHGPCVLTVNKGQLEHETAHLLGKLKVRDQDRHAEVSALSALDPHPILRVVDGGTEAWEVADGGPSRTSSAS